ncbi:DNA-binding protein [Bacillus cereus group sp. MYBK132-2]|uniref:DNA-binding protein n=1 Tax=unclassified Bacillus cereus group TaxID=2750818 RepID=UPI003F79DEB9
MKEIEKYLFLNEAAIKFGIPYETLKNKVKPSLANQEQIEEMIERGIIRFFEAPRDPEKKYTRSKKSWLVTEQAIREWFPE